MAALVDASSPIRFTGSGTGTNFAITSDNFTAPANALIVCCVGLDSQGSATGANTVTDSGGLTWTTQVERAGNETTQGGKSGIFTARTISAVARTVTVTRIAADPSGRVSAKAYVATGADVDGTPVDTVDANNESGSTTNDYTTPSLTPGADGLVFGSDTDWAAQGAFDAGDLTQDTDTYPGQISVCSGWKPVTSGVGVTVNFNAAGTGAAQHKECRIIVRAAAVADTLFAQACL